MSSGFGPSEQITIDHPDGPVTIDVGQWWTSGPSGVYLNVNGQGRDGYDLHMNDDETRQIAALLLEAAGNADIAKTIPKAMAQLSEKERARAEARDKLLEEVQAAKARLLDATQAQRDAYDAVIEQAGLAYTEATGDTYGAGTTWDRCLSWGEPPF